MLYRRTRWTSPGIVLCSASADKTMIEFILILFISVVSLLNLRLSFLLGDDIENLKNRCIDLDSKGREGARQGYTEVMKRFDKLERIYEEIKINKKTKSKRKSNSSPVQGESRRDETCSTEGCAIHGWEHIGSCPVCNPIIRG